MDTTSVTTVELTDSELTLIKNALESFLSGFGHDEADLLHEIHLLLAKFRAVTESVAS